MIYKRTDYKMLLTPYYKHLQYWREGDNNVFKKDFNLFSLVLPTMLKAKHECKSKDQKLCNFDGEKINLEECNKRVLKNSG